jgi:hypothetical protein
MLKVGALALSFGYLSADDISFIVQENPNTNIIVAELWNGRYLTALTTYLMKLLSIDALRNFALFAVFYAVAFVLLVHSMSNYIGITNTNYTALLACSCILFHPGNLDLDQYKVNFIADAEMYIFAGLALRSIGEDQEPGVWPSFRSASFSALSFLSYQPALLLIVIAFLLRWLGLFTAPSFMGIFTRFYKELFRFCAIMAGGLLIAFTVTKLGEVLTGIGFDRISLIAPSNIPWRILQHLHSIANMWMPFRTVQYGSMSAGPVMIIGALVGLISVFCAPSRHRLISLFLLVSILALSQIPIHIFTSDYWPTLRSSFYFIYISPCLIMIGTAHIRQANAVRTSLLGVYVLVCASIFFNYTADRYSTKNRDEALARLVVSRILEAGVASEPIRVAFPTAVAEHREILAVTSGLRSSLFDWSHSAFARPWSRAAILNYVSGVVFIEEQADSASCPSQTNLQPIKITKVEGRFDVCF